MMPWKNHWIAAMFVATVLIAHGLASFVFTADAFPLPAQRRTGTSATVHSFHHHHHQTTTTTTTTTTSTLRTMSNFDTDINIDVQDGSAQAGRDGYSVSRQPLHRSSWDPTLDPTFDAPTTLKEENAQQKNIDWWVNKKQQQQQPSQTNKSLRFTNAGPSSNDIDEPISDIASADTLDLFQRSLETLDFPIVLKALRNECFTFPARKVVETAMYSSSSSSSTFSSSSIPNVESDSDVGVDDSQKSKRSKLAKDGLAYRPLTANSPEEVRARYAGVMEMERLLDPTSNGDVMDGAYYKNRRGYQVTLGNGNPPPLEGLTFDLDSILDIVQKGQILEGPELLEVSTMMNAMEDIQLWGRGLDRLEEPEFVELPRLVDEIDLNTTLQNLLEEAFDENGKLSGKTFPVLGRLRAKVRELKADILQTLDTLVNLPSIKSKLAMESGGPLYSEISNGGGRLVLPMDPKYASQYGIVHDSSRSGRTVYVEPTEVIGPTNDLRQAEGELRAEEARVWRSLTEQVWENRQDLDRSVQAVAQVDLILARYLLGRKINGVIPCVQDEGVIQLRDAKHPVLLLRQIENVVGSDIDLGADGNQGLVLTGPNSGGKTVILKLLGLVALMARSAIPVPAARRSSAGTANGEYGVDGDDDEVGDYQPRVDFFSPVLADIGDIQSVGGDLSTFSGHMLVCREVLANSGKDALVLMDEVGSGTDPAQGVAIAQALLEALLDTGCRVAITTHYMALKQLATSDDRFAVAGMQFVSGRPTYKLLPGTVGESFALAVAERLQLPRSVLDRANELLDSETRQLGDLISELEDQKSVIDEQAATLEAKKKEMAKLEIDIVEEKRKLERKMLTARRDEAKKFAKMLEEKEQVLEDILQRLKSDPSRKVLAKSWDDIKFVKRDALNEAENVPSVQKAKADAARAMEDARAELVPLAELREKPELKEGDVLVVCKPGAIFGQDAKIVKLVGKKVQVTVSGMTMGMKLSELAMKPSGGMITAQPLQNSVKSSNPNASKLSKAAERALKSEGSKKPGSNAVTLDDVPQTKKTASIRLESNTIDVRGCTFEEAKNEIEMKMSQCLMGGQNTIYVLHGHGSGGVLKSKIRNWLKRNEKNFVKSWSSADSADGGDAFTRIEAK